MKYYFGVYIEYSTDKNMRIAQLTMSVDDLSCEILADPGCVTFNSSGRAKAKEHGKHLAKMHNCQYIEFGWGQCKLIKIKP